ILRELLEDLTSGLRETLALRVVLGCSLAEIAESTEVPLNTVRSRLRLAKEAMRRRIEADPALARALDIDLPEINQ
ncbi:MAG: sigma factor-like helix-turn-helix DNA-binding protein, partial [Polyangiaceae bacterium]